MFGIDNNFKDNDITYNRKLKLEEYDDNGNLIDCVEFTPKDLMEFYLLKIMDTMIFVLLEKKLKIIFLWET